MKYSVIIIAMIISLLRLHADEKPIYGDVDGVQRLDAVHFFTKKSWINDWQNTTVPTLKDQTDIALAIVVSTKKEIESIILVENRPLTNASDGPRRKLIGYSAYYFLQKNGKLAKQRLSIVKIDAAQEILKKCWQVVANAKHSTQEKNLFLSKNEEWLLICGGNKARLQVGHALNPPKSGFLRGMWTTLNKLVVTNSAREKPKGKPRIEAEKSEK
jgi:hypothetical protein